MRDATLIADLVRAGLNADLVGRVASAIVEATLSFVPDNVPDMSRTYERERKRAYRKSAMKSGGKQTMSAPAPVEIVPDNVPDNGPEHCILSSLSCLLPEEVAKKDTQESKQVSKKASGSELVSPAAKRGTRLSPDWQLSGTDRQFAHDSGLADAAITQLHAEFVDFWIGVPGQRGTKLNWSATWRNRIRTVRKGSSNGNGRSVLAAADNLINRLGGAEAANAYVPGSSGPKPLDVDSLGLPRNLKLISSG